ncbi:MAG: peptidyl-prolyl cis-trans isomerase [Deltaproteobacteria bacterium]|nr:peptidyl-prolyl cis-trans isomerase [Deltaproteobacteria bacterium]MBI3293718.1 peptidyl-prolyl cis-trans isomerase [Deltaproteobacteria bacterium]
MSRAYPLNRFLATLCLLSACQVTKHDPKLRILARVNGTPITLSEFQLNFAQVLSDQDSIAPSNPKSLDQFKARALNESVMMALVRQEANRRFIKVAKEEVDSRVNNWKDGYPPGGFEEMLRRQRTTEEYLKKRIENQLWVEKVSAEMSGSEILVSDEEMKRYYQQHPNEFFRQERLHALQIVVPTVEEATKLRQEIISGVTTFESAARQYSLSPDASKGGDVGFFSRKEKIEAFDEAFSVPVGAISRPVQSRFGVHLFKVLERQPKRALTFQEAKPELGKLLRRSKEAKVYKEWATKQLKDAEIYRNEALFASIATPV